MVEKIRRLCRERKIPVSKLETDLGFIRGYIYKLSKSSPSVERAKQIADYLGVTVDELIKED